MLSKSKLDEIKKIAGEDNILLSKEECISYSIDAGTKLAESVIPDAVIFVENAEIVKKLVTFANKNHIPIISRGAGTNMVGACACIEGCIVLNFSKMNKILDLDTTNLTITVEPGVVIGEMKAWAEKSGLFFPPDPSNYKVSTIGGAISQASGGANSFKYGTIKDYLLSLKIVMADGSLVTLGGDTPKYAMGYNLAQLMVGSEGTLGVIVEATLKLIPSPECKKVMAAYFDSVKTGVNAVNSVITSHLYPSTIDFMDKLAIKTVEEFKHAGLNTESECMLLIEVDGNQDSVEGDIEKISKILEENLVLSIRVSQSEEEYNDIWDARRASLAAAARLAPDVMSDDIIVPRRNLCEMIEKCVEIRDKYSLRMCLVGHVGDGNIHPQVAFDMENKTELENYIKAKHEMYQLATELGGAISAEHGIGSEKQEYFEQITDGNRLQLMKEIKKIFDENNILNPGKIFQV